MRQHQKGEVVTILAISALVVLGVTTVASSYFINKKQNTTSTKASETFSCKQVQLGDTPACEEFGSSTKLQFENYYWNVNCNAACPDEDNNGNVNDDLGKAKCRSLLGKESDPLNAFWCFGFSGGARCMSFGGPASMCNAPPVQQPTIPPQEAPPQNNPPAEQPPNNNAPPVNNNPPPANNPQPTTPPNTGSSDAPPTTFCAAKIDRNYIYFNSSKKTAACYACVGGRVGAKLADDQCQLSTPYMYPKDGIICGKQGDDQVSLRYDFTQSGAGTDEGEGDVFVYDVELKGPRDIQSKNKGPFIFPIEKGKSYTTQALKSVRNGYGFKNSEKSAVTVVYCPVNATEATPTVSGPAPTSSSGAPPSSPGNASKTCNYTDNSVSPPQNGTIQAGQNKCMSTNASRYFSCDANGKLSTNDCPSGQTCDKNSNTCVSGASATKGLGEVCVNDGSCTAGLVCRNDKYGSDPTIKKCFKCNQMQCFSFTKAPYSEIALTNTQKMNYSDANCTQEITDPIRNWCEAQTTDVKFNVNVLNKGANYCYAAKEKIKIRIGYWNAACRPWSLHDCGGFVSLKEIPLTDSQLLTLTNDKKITITETLNTKMSGTFMADLWFTEPDCQTIDYYPSEYIDAKAQKQINLNIQFK